MSRTQTIVFTDLVDSTAALSGLARDEADSLLNRHFAGLRSAIAVHRGVEVKTLGDGMMAAFDSGADALACAVTMQRSVTRQTGENPEHPLAMRIGIGAGEVSESDGDYFGVPVIEASRLCAIAGPGHILTTDLVRLLVGATSAHRLNQIGPMTLKGLPGPIDVCELTWDDDGVSALRVALADDSALLRQGIAQVLEAEGMDVVLQTGDAETLLDGIEASQPHVAVLDVRMPPTHTTEGLDAAEQIRSEHPQIGVLVLSAVVNASAAGRLLSNGTDGIGYLLKERVADVTELSTAIRTVASGGSAIDPVVVSQLATAG